MSRSKKNKKPALKSKEFIQLIFKAFEMAPGKSLNYKQIASILEISDEPTRILLNATLSVLKDEGELLETERGKFKPKQSDKYVTGRVDMTSSGSAYIIVEGFEKDVYVSQKNLLNAWQGDTVKVYLFPKRKSTHPEGEIIEVIERAKTEIVGIVQISKSFAFLIPDNQRIGTDIYIPLQKLNGVKDGEKAVAKITEWPSIRTKNPEGEIIRILGTPGDNDTEMHAILEEYGLPYEFPAEVEKYAEKLPINISDEEISKRRDFRSITTFTIDPVDAKDFDDALSLEKLDNGNWEIGVHIADVSHYVTPDTILDKEAIERATSVYLVDRVVPMLPEILSNNVCSLRPNEDKLCFSAVFEMNDEAEVLNEWYGRTVICSDRRFSYEEAQEVLDKEEGDYAEELLLLNRMAKKMRKDRFKKGAIGFNKTEVKFRLDDKGNPYGIFFKISKDSNNLIEEFMLLANKKVAELVGKSKVEPKRPFVYRIHDSPNEEKIAQFAEFIKRFGYRINTKTDKELAGSLNKLLSDVKGKKEENLVEQLAVRSMSKAVYTVDNIGHYGLSFPHYTHFTSPIRRYPDVMVHRLLQDHLDKKKPVDAESLELKCKHSSEMEKRAADAERASIKYKQVQYLEDKIGETFEGVISGVTEWGVYVEIIDNKCEGMIRIRDLKDDFYEFDEDNYCLRGKRNHHILQLGDKLLIQVKNANLVKKQLDFTMIKRPEELE